MGDYIVLLHGLGRTDKAMNKLAIFLEDKGYIVINVKYPSTKFDIENLVELYLTKAIEVGCCHKEKKIHFVTHSMGGILARYYLQGKRPENLGRVVMLAPPNQGSQVVDRLKNLSIYKWLLGPAGQQLGTDVSSIPMSLGPVDFELGVIAGNKSINWINSWMIPGTNDGKVSLEATKVRGLQDFLIVPRTHTFIMKGQEVLYQVLHFIENGCFDKNY